MKEEMKDTMNIREGTKFANHLLQAFIENKNNKLIYELILCVVLMYTARTSDHVTFDLII